MDILVYTIFSVLSVALVYYLLIAKRVIREFECGLLYCNGCFRRQVGPGAHRILRFRTKIDVVDLRRRVVTVPGQEVLTADQVGVKVSLVVTYVIADPEKALHQVQDYSGALYAAVQLALRKAVGAVPLEQLLEQRLEIGNELTSEVQVIVEQMGLQVTSIGVKDVMLSGDVKRAFSEVVRARKEGQAALERARGETAALRNLANAARMLQDNPALLNLRLLQTLSTGTAAPTVVFNAPGVSVPPVQPMAGPTHSDDRSS
jgi:regulator of protease activity HflC (stomatin/prohibitin superfamily)